MDAEVNAENLREDERMLQVIDQFLSSRDHDYERNKEILKEILADVFIKMKGRDRFIREQFEDFFLVEKYYRGPTRHFKLEKFYVNVIFKIVVNPKDILVRDSGELAFDEYPRWLYRRVNNILSAWVITKNSQWNVTYYLDKKAFRQSIERSLARAILNVPKIDNYTIKEREDTSVLTLWVRKQGFPEMNVSLMPVLEFDCNPPHPFAKEGFKWYTMPEPLNDGQNSVWRLFLYNHEIDLLTRHSYLIPVIRQLEKLRDTQEWQLISHYCIKTLAMHYASSVETDTGLPDACKLTGIHLFIHMLDELRNTCKTGILRNFWNSNDNLIDADENQFVDIAEQLTTMINEIIDDPTKVADWILTADELSMYQNELKAVGILQGTDFPSKRLQMSEVAEPDLSDVRNTTDGISKSVAGAVATSGDIASSPCTEAGNEKADCTEEMDMLRLIADHRSSVETLSRRMTVLEQKSAATA